MEGSDVCVRLTLCGGNEGIDDNLLRHMVSSQKNGSPSRAYLSTVEEIAELHRQPVSDLFGTMQ